MEHKMDADEQALRDAVVEDGTKLVDVLATDVAVDIVAAERKLSASVEALRTHSTKLEPAPRCEPPPDAKDGSVWWLVDRAGEPEPWKWVDGAWIQFEDAGSASTEFMQSAGWTVHSECIFPVAKPETTALVEPDDVRCELAPLTKRLLDAGCKVGSCICGASLYSGLAEHQEDCWHRLFIEAANEIAAFKPQVQKVEASDEANPYARQCAVQDSVDIFRIGIRANESLQSFVQRIAEPLAKFTPYNPEPLSDDEIFKLGVLQSNFRIDPDGPHSMESPHNFQGFAFRIKQLYSFARAIEAKVRGTA